MTQAVRLVGNVRVATAIALIVLNLAHPSLQLRHSDELATVPGS